MTAAMAVSLANPVSIWRLFERAVSTVIYCGYFGFLGYLLSDTTGIYFGVAIALHLYYLWGGAQRHYTKKVRNAKIWNPEIVNHVSVSAGGESKRLYAYEPGYVALAACIYTIFLTLEIPIWLYALNIAAKKTFTLHPDQFAAKIAPFKEMTDLIISVVNPFAAYRNFLGYAGEVDRLLLADFILSGICVVAGYFLCRIAYSWIVETINYQSLVKKNNEQNKKITTSLRPIIYFAALFGIPFLFGLWGTFIDIKGVWIISSGESESLGLPFIQVRPVEWFIFDLIVLFFVGNLGGSAFGYLICQWIGNLNYRWRRGRETTV